MNGTALDARRPAAAGLRWGLALGLFEIGLAVPVRFAHLSEPLRQALFFLLPLGAYALAGAFLGSVAGLPGRLRPGLRAFGPWLPAAAALVLAALDLLRNLDGLGAAPWGPGLGGVAGALVLRARGRAARSLAWAGSASILLAAAGTAWWLAGERDPAQGVRPPPGRDDGGAPDVVLITWDTVRAGLLPLYGGTGLETPSLDALAARSVVFDQMSAVAPITGPSHATLLTGVAPPSHGLRSNGSTAIAWDVPRLAESFRDAGYDTAAFVAAYPVKGKFGFAKGFRVYDDRLNRDRLEALLEIGPREMSLIRAIALWFKRNATAAIQGEVVLPRFLGYLREARRPFFAWVHFFDAHGPFQPADPFRDRALALADDAQPLAPEEEFAGFLTLHRGEIMELDAFLGEILAGLEDRDPGLNHTAVFLTADHGHCFGDHGYGNTHLPSLLESTQHVPAVLHLPGGAGSGQRFTGLVNQVDVAPTLCAVAGIAPAAASQGVSLLPAAEGLPLPPRRFFQDGFYMEAYQDILRKVLPDGSVEDERKIGLRTPGWKYWEWVNVDGPPVRWALYDLARGEDDERSAAEPAVLSRMQAALRRLKEDPERLPVVLGEALVQTPADRGALQQLGYINGGG